MSNAHRLELRVSYAQNGEDVRAWRALRDRSDVFYVEVGASHPYDHSLTAALAAEGWRGVLVEPEPAAAELLRTERPRDVVVAAAASDAPGILQWVNDGDRGEGRIADDRPGLAVPVVRLSDVLEGVGATDVHFMSVDVEGHERRALLGLDLGRWRPWILCVESTAPLTRTPTHDAWEGLLLDAGYRFVAFDGLNRWYVAPEHPELAEAVAEPFGVLDMMIDRWQRRDVVDLDARVRQLEQAYDDVSARLDVAVQRASRTDALVDQLRRTEAALARLQDESHLVALQRDAALAREDVMRVSKSWRVTAPLRTLRWNAGLRLGRTSARRADAAGPAVRTQPLPGDERRLRALAHRVRALRERAEA